MIKKISYNGRDEWLSLRKGYIGGSDAGAVIGLNPYKSAYTLWAEKTGKIPEFDGNITTRVGAYLEDLVAMMFMEETGKSVRRMNKMLVNDEYPFACADVDRVVVGESAIVEIKTTNSIPNIKKFKNGEYPESWYAQMTHYLAVSGMQKAYLAVLIECREFRIFELERDEAEIATLMEAERCFWELVQSDVPPLADGSDSSTKTIAQIYPESAEAAGVADLNGYGSVLDEYIALGAQIKNLEELKDRAANKVKLFLGDRGRGESDRHKVNWTSSERSSFDSKRFANEHPEIDLSDYYKTSVVRAFKVTEKKER